MSVPSPIDGDTSVVALTIKVDGKEIDDAIQILSVDCRARVNQVPKAEIVLLDGDPAKEEFEVSARATFLPGAKVEIEAGYGDKTTTIFKGVIYRHGLAVDRTTGPSLVLEAADDAMGMTLARKNAVFEDMKDGDLIGKLVGDHGLSKDVASTDVKHERVIQHDATDWDMMVARADVNGMVVMVDGGKVVVKKPDTGHDAVLRVSYGETIFDLEAEMDATSQFGLSNIHGFGWDSATQATRDGVAANPGVTELGNVTSAKLSEVWKGPKLRLQTGGELAMDELKAWATAAAGKSAMSKIRGSVRFQGSALAKLGAMIELEGLGARFNGNAFISGVHHGIRSGQWLTTVDFGLSPRWFAEETQRFAAPGAAGQLAPIRGLQTGLVQKIDADKESAYRVQVELPLLAGDGPTTVWARLGTVYASNGFGAFFYPEVGDEVILGFMNEDPRFAVILGSVYGKQRKPAFTPDEKNKTKAITTRSKLEISFDEEDKVIEIKTPGNHVIRLDDKAKKVSITDSNKNSAVFSQSGIALDSPADIQITAKGNIQIEAVGNLSLSAKANATMEGLQVQHTAQTKFSAAGNAAAEVTSSGMLTIRGSLVQIN